MRFKRDEIVVDEVLQTVRQWPGQLARLAPHDDHIQTLLLYG